MARLCKHMHGLVQSEHFAAKYIMTALMELGLSKSLNEAWLEHTWMYQPTPS